MYFWGIAAAAVAAAAMGAPGATPVHGGGSGDGGGQPVWSSPALVALRGEVSGGPASGSAAAAEQTHGFMSDEHRVAHQHAHPCVVRGAATASCFGYNATDSTDILQAALSMPSVSTLTIDRPPGGQAAWLVRPLYITRHNLAVVLAEGVLVLAKQDEFHGSDDSLLKLEGAENITIMGRVGSAMRMRRADYAVPSWGSCPSCRPYLKAEWRAGIWIGGCKNVTLAGLEVTETGGDGLYVDDLRKVGTSLLASRDIHVHDCVFDRNYRQGLSVISVINLLVERCTFSNTNGTDPQAGVDLEPDLPSNVLTNVTFRDCVYSGNSGAGFRTCLNAMNGSTAPVSILFSGADVHNNTVMQDRPSKSGYIGQSVGASYFRPGLQGAVTYQDIAVRSCSSAGIEVRYKTAGGPLLTLRNISLANVAWADRAYPDPTPGADLYRVGPVMFIGDLLPNVNGFLGGFPTLGGVVFDGLRIQDNVSRPWLFVDTTAGVTADWSSITATGKGVRLSNEAGGCYVKHNHTNVTSLLPFSAECNQNGDEAAFLRAEHRAVAAKTTDEAVSLGPLSSNERDPTGARAAALQKQVDRAIEKGQPTTIKLSGVYKFSDSSLHLEGCEGLSLVGDGASTTTLLFQGGARFPKPLPKKLLPKVHVHGPGGPSSMKVGFRLYPNPLGAGGTHRDGSTPQTCQRWCASNTTCEGAVFVESDKRCYSLPKVLTFYKNGGMSSWSRAPVQQTNGPPGQQNWVPAGGLIKGVNATNCRDSAIKQLNIDYEPKPTALFCFAGKNTSCDEGPLGITVHFFNSSRMNAQDVKLPKTSKSMRLRTWASPVS